MACRLVLLAAGLSRRFGAENKLLIDWRGKPLYRHTLDRLERLWQERPTAYTLLVVTQYPEIAAHCAGRGIPCVHNPRAAEGISTSLQLGLRSGGVEEATAFFVADQPGLRLATIRGFLEGYAASGKGLGCVSHAEVPGNPCVFSARYADELLCLTGDRGGKAVLLRHLEDCWRYPIAESSQLVDIDLNEECIHDEAEIGL